MDSIDRTFADGFNEAHSLYQEDRLDECIEKARAILASSAIPRYRRIKTLVLLGSTLGDWKEANDCCVEANTLWRIVRRWHPVGHDAKIDEAMEEESESVAELREALDGDEDKPPEYDPKRSAELQVARCAALVPEEDELVDAEQEDPDMMLRVDAAALNETHEKLAELNMNGSHAERKPSQTGVPVGLDGLGKAMEKKTLSLLQRRMKRNHAHSTSSYAVRTL
ncbi:hypothetical protein LTR85_000342 [Meristemomyces frigidus]|nr:hypothetical protein LTR85_000342 [Meristemomyces frigidus]